MIPISVFANLDVPRYLKNAKTKNQAIQIKNVFMERLMKGIRAYNAEIDEPLKESQILQLEDIYNKAFNMAIFCKFQNYLTN